MREKGESMGGFGGATGKSLPPKPSQTGHIFGDRPGHLPHAWDSETGLNRNPKRNAFKKRRN